MSRLTSRVPFNRPSVLDVLHTRPAPLSPPETDLEPGPPSHEEKHEYVSPEVPTDTPTPRIRKVSTIAYSSGGLSNREPRPVQRQQRWLVMVVPSASITREPPVLGHTLSSAPAGRFSNGILMPLFPTLYGQLTAIAREFNIPSTTGLCVYLQLQDSGPSVMTPRISDESWQLLWSQFFVGEERVGPMPPHGLPISGRIEFDIDLKRAKWFNTWMGNSVWERAESESISREPSMVPSHWRNDSRTSLFFAEQVAEESPSPAEAIPPGTIMSSRTALQHLPRPLLLERRDASSVRSISRLHSRAPSNSHDFSSPAAPVQTTSPLLAEATFVPNTLSPMVQEQEEPQTAKRAELDSLVHQWRQSSVLGAASTALAAAGQPSIDPVNMSAGTDVELDLNDFAWSISSAGPPSESPVTPHWPKPLPSVHLLGRLQGSVCLTPSICTSFGPPDYDWPESPVSCVSRRPSPDLGMRMLEFVGLTPTTATSWGPDDLPSPTSSEHGFQYRAPSVDIGVRGMGSRPVTPSTATSWGPPDSPSILPDTPIYIRTPDVGERVFTDFEMGWPNSRALVFPYYNEGSTQFHDHVSLSRPDNRRTNEDLYLSLPMPRNRNEVLLPEWPHFAALYPSDSSTEWQPAANKCQPVGLSAPVGYPNLELYPPVYPYNLDFIYPVPQHQPSISRVKEDIITVTPAASSTHSTNLLPEWPDFAALYPSDPTTERAAANKSQPVLLSMQTEYPFFNVYPNVYPHHLDEIYPAFWEGEFTQETYRQEVTKCTDEILDAVSPVACNVRRGRLPEWPDFAALYPADPSMEQAANNKCQPVQLPRAIGYPVLEIYPSAYPYNLDQIYPALLSQGQPIDNQRSNSTIGRREAKLTELLPEWPNFASLNPADPSIEWAGANKVQSVVLPRYEGYPSIVIYPAVYPYSLQYIYPDVQTIPRIQSSNMAAKEINSIVTAHQPLPEYPDFAGLYPSDPLTDRVGANKSQPVELQSMGYPFLSIYSPVYPFNLTEIYGPCHSINPACEENALCEEISVRLPVYSGYPNFNLYPAPQGFPTFEIYPPIKSNDLLPILTISTKLNPAYPVIEPYEPVYPYLVIYPQTELPIVDDLSLSPISHRRRAPTPAPGRHRARPSWPSLAAEQQPDTQRRLSRSPVQRELAPPLPSSTPASTVKPSANGSPYEQSSLFLMNLPLGPLGDHGMPTLPIKPQQSHAPRNKPKRTHYDLHMLVFSNLPKEDSQHMEEFIPELPSRSTPASAPPASAPLAPALPRQRTRSGTITGRASAPVSRPVPGRAAPNAELIARRSYRSSVSMNPTPVVGASSIPDDVRSHPIPSSETPAPSIGRKRAPSVSGLPSSPADTHYLLNRVQSMNTPGTPRAVLHVTTEPPQLDRSKSMSHTNRVGTNRQSIVLERAKIFTVLEQGSDVDATLKLSPSITSRSVSKLDRSKHPFQ